MKKLNTAMRRITLFSFVLLVLCCNDKDNWEPEEALRISTDATSYMILSGPELDLTVQIESKMPPNGVNIQIRVTEELTGSVVSLRSEYANQRAVPLKITSIPRQVICVCTITVVSKGDQSNQAAASFRVAYK
jgi:hypothetical protein